MEKGQFRVVFVTVPDVVLADEIAKGLVQNKFAACVSVIPGVTSHYRWEGALQQDQELLLVIKTRAGLMPDIIGFIKGKHLAKTPEIIALPIVDGEKNYLEWVAANTLFTKAQEDKLPY